MLAINHATMVYKHPDDSMLKDASGICSMLHLAYALCCIWHMLYAASGICSMLHLAYALCCIWHPQNEKKSFINAGSGICQMQHCSSQNVVDICSCMRGERGICICWLEHTEMSIC